MKVYSLRCVKYEDGLSSGDMIQCDSCNEWFHKSCKQIDDKYFDIPDIYPDI